VIRGEKMDKLRLMSKVAKMYYEENLTQEEISKITNIPRSTISKLLNYAKKMGYIRVVLDFPNQDLIFLEREIEKLYGIKECVVVEREEDIGTVGAKYIENVLDEDEVVGVSWGMTLEKVVKYLKPFERTVKEVVQIVGGLGEPNEDYHATNLAKELARKLNAKVSVLQAPGIAKNLEIKKAFLSDPNIVKCLEKVPSITAALVGIGTLHEDSTLIVRGKILSENDRQTLISSGCVGDVALIFFDRNGKPVCSDISKRVIGITYEQLKKVKKVIAFAGGPKKIEAIRGALKGKLITMLVTNKEVAERLIEIDRRRSA